MGSHEEKNPFLIRVAFDITIVQILFTSHFSPRQLHSTLPGILALTPFLPPLPQGKDAGASLDVCTEPPSILSLSVLLDAGCFF